MTRAWTRAILWVAGAALGAASAVTIALSDTVNHGFIAFSLIVGWSFIATGLVALARRPENRFGLLLYAVGVDVVRRARSRRPGTPTSSRSASWWAPTLLRDAVHAILAYPRGRLESRAARRSSSPPRTPTRIGIQAVRCR